ncbi:MAG: ATPase [Neomegalonema sp.]|nr:ATPase [Neomegalonema sp.]
MIFGAAAFERGKGSAHSRLGAALELGVALALGAACRYHRINQDRGRAPENQERAEPIMTESWGTSAPLKRFYKQVAPCHTERGWTVTLDGRNLKTPAKAEFLAPQAIAEAAAAEWDAQQEHILPDSMPITRAVNSAIDRVAPQREGVIDQIWGYGGTDMLCYRADHPIALIERQALHWDPLLDWARERLGAPLCTVEGVMYKPQPEPSLERLRTHVAAIDDLGLTALYDLVALSGSLIVGLAVMHQHLDAETAWALARLDEEFQIEQFGRDEEAEAMAQRKRRDFLAANHLMTLLRQQAAPDISDRP